jgi:sterol desaturase/sphingolipid hydroxylase (fatty acid hydroxylase superfamily)
VLWKIHKVHHSSRQLDWLANWRFHFLEAVIYRSLLYAPLAMVGFADQALFANGVFGTLMGHYAHANFKLHPGIAKYLINSPQMHIWHHVHASAGPVNKNFGIALSCWDWIFGTAYMPDREPERLGFAGDESYPESWWGQTAAPFRKSGAGQ